MPKSRVAMCYHSMSQFHSNISMFVFLALQLLLVSSVAGFSTDGEVSMFYITCDPLSEIGCQDDTLQTIAGQVEEQSDVQIDIKIPRITLNDTVIFANLNSLRIIAETSQMTIVCDDHHSNNGTGFVLKNISNTIIMTNVTLLSCGSFVCNSFDNGKFYSSALSIISCRNFEANHVVIEKNKGIGLMMLNHQEGVVKIKSSIFKENILPKEYASKSILGGGGAYILIGRTSHDASYSESSMSTSIQFLNCTFENNSAHVSYYKSLYSNILGKLQTGYGRGGGVHLSFVNGSRDVNVTFAGNKFIANKAHIGGGLSVRVYGKKVTRYRFSNIKVEIKDSIFRQNGCNSKNTSIGGGIMFSFRTSFDESLLKNIHYLVSNVSFLGNCASFGGGVCYFSDRDRLRDLGNSMVFNNSTFEGNIAHTGSAVAMAPNQFLKLSTGFVIVPVFRDCLFLYNNVKIENIDQTELQWTEGIGTIHSSNYDIHFQGHNHFRNNWGTAIYVINGYVNFKNSCASFINNNALRGGAITLIGSSTILVGTHNYVFVNNTASDKGGAIYVEMIDNNDFTISKSCFIQYADDFDSLLSSEWNANITFIGNRVKHGNAGHAIYVTSLFPCQVINNGSDLEPDYTPINITDVLSVRHIQLDVNETLQPQVATDGALFITNTLEKPPLKIIPGEKYLHGLKINDDLGHEVKTLFGVYITGANHSHNNIHLDPSLPYYVGDKIQLNGKQRDNAVITFNVVSPRNSYVQLQVEMQECPPGFQISNESKCVCNTDAYVGLLNCNRNLFHSHILPGYWAGFIDTSDGPELVTSPCPFCDYNKSLTNSIFKVPLPRTRDHSEMNTVICGKTRTGLVCGRCQEGYTVHFHSPGFLCKPAEPVGCKLGWFFYILSELVPVTVVFITVLVLNISFTSGAVNGFILFSQLLESLDTDARFLSSTSKRVTKGYKVFYGFFNLNFFNSESLSFCLWKSATAIDMLAFKYVTILYTLLLIVAVIWLMNRYGGRCCGKFCRISTVRKSVIHGISTFLVICYTQCVNVFLNLLNPIHLYAGDDSDFNPPVQVWLNGDIGYFSKQHLPYALPSIISLITIGLLPPALLITFPLLNKLLATLCSEDSKVMKWIGGIYRVYGLKPLLDSFQGCFKDNFRFFAGLYFLYRWMFLVIDLNTTDYGSYYTAVCGTLVVVLSLHTIYQPYKERAHNIIDALLIADLLFINALSFYHYHRIHYQLNLRYNYTTVPSVLQMVLICIPLVMMAAYLLVITCKAAVNYNTGSINKLIPSRANNVRKLVIMISRRKDEERSELTAFEDLSYNRQRDESRGFTSTGDYFKCSCGQELDFVIQQ